MAKTEKPYCSDFRQGGPTNPGEKMKPSKSAPESMELCRASEHDQRGAPAFPGQKSVPVKAAAKTFGPE